MADRGTTREGDSVEKDDAENENRNRHLHTIHDGNEDHEFLQLMTENSITQDHVCKTQRTRNESAFRPFRTIAAFVAFYGDGIPLGLLGTCLVDLAAYMGVGIKEMSTIFIWRFAGNVIGNVLSGYMYDQYDHHFLLVIVQIISGVMMCAAPWWPNLPLFSTFIFLLGIAHGGFGPGVNSCIVHLWRERSSPFIHCLFISVMVGGAVTSQMVKPFLPEKEAVNVMWNNLTNHNIPQNCVISSQSDMNITSSDGGRGIHWAFVTSGGLAMALSLCNVAAFILNGRHLKQDKVTRTEYQASDEEELGHTAAPYSKQLLVWMLFFCLTFLIGGLEQSYGGLVSAFVVRSMCWSSSQAADMTTVFYGCLALGRLLAAFTSPYVKHTKTMAVVAVILCIGNGSITVASSKSPVVVWVCTGVIAASLSPGIPLSLSWGRGTLGMTAKCPAVLLAGYNTGRMSTPVLVGYLLDQLDPTWFLYAGLLHSVAIVVIFIVLYCKTERR